MTVKKALISFALSFSIMPVAQASSMTIDGNLSDWGLQRKGKTSDWTPNPSLGSSLKYVLEDDNARGRGGQAYDAEALYSFMDGANLYIALVTGLDPNRLNDPSRNTYGPGDFAIDFTNYGSDGSFEFGIQTTGTEKGNIYQNVSWDLGLWDTKGEEAKKTHKPVDPKHPTSIVDGTGSLVGTAALEYTDNYFKKMGLNKKDKHYVIEAAIPLIAFTGFSGEFVLHWTMNCANDAIQLISSLPELASISHNSTSVPEPTTLALIALGMLGLKASQRSRTTALSV